MKRTQDDSEKYWVYIVKCKDGTYYTGYTNDLHRRVETHNRGKGALYTSYRRPVILVYTEQYNTRSLALKREYEIKKRYTRAMKQKLILECNKKLPYMNHISKNLGRRLVNGKESTIRTC